MTLREFAERCIKKLAERQRKEDHAMTATVLEQTAYAKRVGASNAYQQAAEDITATLKEAGDVGDEED